MTAHINYGSPPPGCVYYNLPLFDVYQKPLFQSFMWITLNGKPPEQYYLWFSFEDSCLDYFGRNILDLNDNQIRLINETYFMMLDKHFTSAEIEL